MFVEITREMCREQAFDVIVELNRNGILGRLDSAHAYRPTYRQKVARHALTIRLKALFDKTMKASGQDSTVSDEIKTINETFLRLESLKVDDCINILERIVKRFL